MKILFLTFLLLPAIAFAQTGPVTLLNGVWASAQVAFGSITGSYATALNDTHQKRLCILQNTTDKTISFSDGSNNPIVPELLPNVTVVANFATNGRAVATVIKVKYTNGAPTSGNAQVACLW